MKNFHGKQKVKLKWIIHKFKRDYSETKDLNTLKKLDEYYKLLYHISIFESSFGFKKRNLKKKDKNND